VTAYRQPSATEQATWLRPTQNWQPSWKRSSNTGATYVAANTWSLVDEPAQLYYHLPAGVSDSRKKSLATYLDEEVGHRPYERQVGTIRIGGQATPARVTSFTATAYTSIAASGVHRRWRGRTQPVEIEDGVDNAREVVATEPDIHRGRTRRFRSNSWSKGWRHRCRVGRDVPRTSRDRRDRSRPSDSDGAGQGRTHRRPHRRRRSRRRNVSAPHGLTMDGPYGSTPDWTALYVGDSVGDSTRSRSSADAKPVVT